MSDSKSTIQPDFLEHNLHDTAREQKSRVSGPELLPSRSKAANDQYLLGNYHLQQRGYRYAIDAYRRALELDPECAAIHHSLGLAYYKEGEFEDARDSFQKAISLNPLNANYHYVLGQLQQDDGVWELAIDEFTKAINLEPSFAEAWYDRGLLYDKLNEFEKACDDFGHIIELEPNSYTARRNLGVLYIKRKMWAEAKQVFEDTLAIKSRDADAHYYLAEVHLNLSKDINLAIDSLEYAIASDPDHLDARFTLGILYTQNRYDRLDFRQKAIDQFTALIKHSEVLKDFYPVDRVFFLLGSLYDDDPKDAELAIAAYKAGLEHSPSSSNTRTEEAARVRNNLGLLYLQKNQPEQAAEEFRQAIQLKPNYEAAYYNLAKLYFYDRDEELSKDLDQWLTHQPQTAVAMIKRLVVSLTDVAGTKVYQSLYSRLHRVKNLISVSGGQLQSVLGQTDPSSELHNRIARALTQQEESYNEMVSLLRTLPVEPPVFGLTDVNRIIEALLRELEPVFESKGIEWEPLLDTRLPSVKGDLSRLKEAFNNLIINAIDAMEDGGFLKIQTVYEQQHSQIQVSFTDTGVGISDEERHKIFQAGYTLKRHGSGFGLNIVQQTVRDHSGVIECDSEEGCGTTFTIFLPVDSEAAPIKTNLQIRPNFYEVHHNLAFEELV